jgi:PIN domain nuclease of toxin-antitoxin system
MKLLLDTHVFLWFITGSPKLDASVIQAIRDPANEVYLSAVSVWEAIVKQQLGKLPLPEPAQLYLPQQRDRHGIASLALDEASVAKLAGLPPVHRDPFDRMLVCQAISNALTLVTVDPVLSAYPVSLLGRVK